MSGRKMIVVVLAVLAFASRARAWDPFEIEVFHPRLQEPGNFSLELANNYVPDGVRMRPSPQLTTDQVLHSMLDASYGISEEWEVGAHLLFAERGHDAQVDFAGVRVRGQWRAALPHDAPLQFGLNLEISVMPDTYDPGIATFELRPIVEWNEGDFELDLNPTLVAPFAGDRPGIPSFEPSIAARYRFFGTVQISVEYYATSGTLTHVAPVRRQEHYVFETVNIVAWPAWILRAGIGEGLTPGSDGIVLTLVLGHVF